MRLKQVDINGFKSFPDQVKISFDGGITSFVGPNGSGKSNIVDAVRWVLGEQSSKSLRGSKMEDVIFVGSADRKPVGMAEVSLVIDNTDGELQTPLQEVRVTRRIYRSGESEYLLAGKPVRLKDIHELFMNTGLGRDGYSIIGQGRIAEVLSARGEERRAIIEEAAGISKVRYRRLESMRRLESTEENLVRLRDILSGYAERVGPLAAQSEKAKKYLDFREERKQLEINLWLLSLEGTQQQMQSAEEDYAVITAQLLRMEDAQRLLDETQEQLTLTVSQLHADIDLALREQRSAAERAGSLRAEAAVADSNARHNSEKRQALTESRRMGEARRAELLQRKQQLEQKQFALSEEIERRNRSLVERQEGLQRERLDEMERTFARDRLLQLELADKTTELRVAEADTQAGLSARGARLDAIEAESLRLSEVLAQTAQSETAWEGALRQAQQEIAGCNNALEGRRRLLAGKQARAAEASAALETARRTLAERSDRLALLTELEKSREGYSSAVKLVLEESQRGRLRGIHGALSPLIETEQRFTMAIETALGGALQNIVVDNEQQAKAVIELLKNRNAGRVTLLPISSVRKRGSFPDAADSLGVASRFVNCDAKYREIVDFLLGNTLVSPDMNAAVATARRIEYRTRIVTLDGQIINAGGSMTGGSQARDVGLLSRRNEIENCRLQCATLSATVQQEERTAAALQGELALVLAEMEGANAELQIALQEEVRCTALLEGERSKLGMLQEQCKAVEHERAGLRQQQDDDLAALRRTSDQLADLQRRQSELEQGFAEAQVQHAQALRHVEAAMTEINAEHVELARLTQERTGLFDTGEELLQTLSLAETDDRQLEQQEEELAQTHALLTAEAKEKAEQAECFARREQEQAETVAHLTLQREAAERRQVELRQQAKEAAEQKELLVKEQVRAEGKRQAVESERERMLANLWDEYELTLSRAQELRTPLESKSGAQKRAAELRAAMKQLGHVNLDSIEEYKEVRERFDFFTEQISDLETAKAELTGIIEGLTDEMRSIFLQQFTVINERFRQTFRDLFGGGSAQLTLSDPDNMLESGIDITVQPEGKVIHSLSSLSGGEQALTAIALYFSMLAVRPSPFVILDEIDTSLDEVNVNRLAGYYTRFTGETQLILVTHRRGAMEISDILYGVTMQEKGVSKLLRIDVNDVEKKIRLKA